MYYNSRNFYALSVDYPIHGLYRGGFEAEEVQLRRIRTVATQVEIGYQVSVSMLPGWVGSVTRVWV